MTFEQLADKLAKLEGKRHQASIGDVRELLKLLCELEAEAIHKGTDHPSSLIRARGMDISRKIV